MSEFQEPTRPIVPPAASFDDGPLVVPLPVDYEVHVTGSASPRFDFVALELHGDGTVTWKRLDPNEPNPDTIDRSVRLR